MTEKRTHVLAPNASNAPGVVAPFIHAGLLAAALVLGACASNEKEKPDAYADYVAVTELEEQAMIRSYIPFEQHVLSDHYVIVYTRHAQYLMAYSQSCYVAYNMPRKPDRRADPYAIYADTDTFRGCHIDKLYAITIEQVAELLQMGLAPGEG